MATRTPESFDETYTGTPPWDIGRPQPALVALADKIQGRVLDVGCGTGENALHLAAKGHDVWGIDAAPRAIAKAQQKAKDRHLKVTFHVHDALRLDALHQRFDTVIDSGLFHVFSDAERPRYVEGLRAVLRPGGSLFILAFSDKEPTNWGGPRRIARHELETAFAHGWTVISIDAVRFATNLDITGHAWAAHIRRD